MSLDEYQIKKLESESERNDAERRKILKEMEVIDKRLHERIYTSKNILQAVVGGIVAAALISAWGIGYLKPILERNKELATIENKILSNKIERQKQLNVIEREKIATENSQYKKQLENIIAKNRELQSQQSDLKSLSENLKAKLDGISTQYTTLSQKFQLSEAEKENYNQLSTEASDKSKRLDFELEKLQTAAAISKAQEVDISSQIATLGLVGSKWSVINWDGNTDQFDIIFRSGSVLEVNLVADVTPDNDSWTLSGNQVKLMINDEYVTLTGEMEGKVIEGTAESKSGNSWKWKAERKDKS